MSTNKTPKSDTHRDEQRRARRIHKEQNISYQAALQIVRSLHKESSTAKGDIEPQNGTEENVIKITSSEESYRTALIALTAQVEEWLSSCGEDEDCDGGHGSEFLLHDAETMSRRILDGLRHDNHKYRVKLDMTEVARNTLRRFAEAVANHDELCMAYNSSPNHSSYEADEELSRELRSVKRFLADADKPEYREHYTHEDNPLRQIEAVPVPVPDPDGATADGIRQGTQLRSTYDAEEVRTLLMGPYKDHHLSMVVRVSDPRDSVVPQPGDNSSWGGYTILVDQLRMLFEPIE